MDARQTAVTTLVLAALTQAGCPTRDDPVDFERRRPEPARIAEQLKADTDTLGQFTPSEQAQRVIKFFQQANLQTVSIDPVEPAELEKGFLNLRLAAKHLLMESGQKVATQLGLHLLGRFEAELAKLAAASRKVDGATVALLSGAPPPAGILEAYQRFARFGGGFLVLAAANGLIGQGQDGGLEVDEADRFFIRLAFKVYWANVLPEGTNAIEWMLTDFERRWYEIWVLERSRTAPLVRKQAALRYLVQHDPDYPARMAQGVVLYQNKQYEKAAQAFEQALKDKPDDEKLKRFLAAAKRKAR